MSLPVKSAGMGAMPRMEMPAVSGRLSWDPRRVNEASVSPRPWRRIRMLTGGCDEGGGMMDRVREGGKSLGVGRRGIVGGKGSLVGGGIISRCRSA